MCDDALALSASGNSSYQRNMSRTNEIIAAAVKFIKNATLPPTFESINQLLRGHFSDFSEEDAQTLKEVLPVFYGPGNAILKCINLKVGESFPLDLFLLILEYKGARDTLDIYYGKARRIGKQLKDVFEQSNLLEVNSYAYRDPSHNLQSACQGIVESKFLRNHFSVYMNGKLAYLGECSPNVVMPIFNTIVHFDTPDEQIEILGKWNSYISQFRSFKEFPVPVIIKVSDNRDGVKPMVENWLREVGVVASEVKIVANANKKVFLNPDKRGVDPELKVAAPIEIGEPVKARSMQRVMKKLSQQGTKKPWSHERPVEELRQVIMELVSWLKVKVATILLEKVTIPPPNL